MGNDTCLKCSYTPNAWWHKAAGERDPPVSHPKVHPFESRRKAELQRRHGEVEGMAP